MSSGVNNVSVSSNNPCNLIMGGQDDNTPGDPKIVQGISGAVENWFITCAGVNNLVAGGGAAAAPPDRAIQINNGGFLGVSTTAFGTSEIRADGVMVQPDNILINGGTSGRAYVGLTTNTYTAVVVTGSTLQFNDPAWTSSGLLNNAHQQLIIQNCRTNGLTSFDLRIAGLGANQTGIPPSYTNGLQVTARAIRMIAGGGVADPIALGYITHSNGGSEDLIISFTKQTIGNFSERQYAISILFTPLVI